MNFIDKKVSVKKAIAILARNDIQVNEEEAVSIIDFLYLIAKNYQVTPHAPDAEALRRNRTSEKMQ